MQAFSIRDLRERTEGLSQETEKGPIPEIKNYLEALQNANYSLSGALLDKALDLAGE